MKRIFAAIIICIIVCMPSWAQQATKGARQINRPAPQTVIPVDKKADKKASRYAIEAQLRFWKSMEKAKAKTPAEANQFSAAIGKNVKRLWIEMLTLDPTITEAREKPGKRAANANANEKEQNKEQDKED
ncbi:MAG: hypothetical protein NTV58_08265 [Deltaproteobacteria bacterium]|nr:hypothetical protein [Deltaproteobacteria bacterium]